MSIFFSNLKRFIYIYSYFSLLLNIFIFINMLIYNMYANIYILANKYVFCILFSF